MERVTLAKALKIKNRLVKTISKKIDDVRVYNVRVANADVEIDTSSLFEEVLTLTNKLVQLKADITNANTPIQARVYEMAELKGLIVFLNGLDTTHGLSLDRYTLRAEQPIEYCAAIRKADVDNKISELQKTIDDIQDQVDQFNHGIYIEIDSSLL